MFHCFAGGAGIRRRVVLLLGGARSGKSDLALKLLARGRGKRGYIATAQALDVEMSARIRVHRGVRGSQWETFEIPIELPCNLEKIAATHSRLLVDCLTLWLSNVLARNRSDRSVLQKIDLLAKSVRKVSGRLVLVSNEVGLGVVPDHPLGRRFRDLSGIMHQKLAAAADEVYWVMAGLSLRLK